MFWKFSLLALLCCIASVVAVPTAPTNVYSSTNEFSSSVKVYFTASTSTKTITLYRVYINGVSSSFTSTSAGSITVTGLTNGVTVYVTVRATDADGTSSDSLPTYVTPGNGLPLSATVCYGARNRADNSQGNAMITVPTVSSKIWIKLTGVQMSTFGYNGVSCAIGVFPLNYWGCSYWGNELMIQAMSGSTTVWPDTSDTSLTWSYKSLDGKSVPFWYSSSYTWSSPAVAARVPSLTASTIKLGYNEDLYDVSESDNGGTACAQVTMQFDSLPTLHYSVAGINNVTLYFSAPYTSTTISSYKVYIDGVATSFTSTSAGSIVVTGLNGDAKTFTIVATTSSNTQLTSNAVVDTAIYVPATSSACDIDSWSSGSMVPYFHSSTGLNNDVFSLYIAVPVTYKSPSFTLVSSDASCLANSDWTLVTSTSSFGISECYNLYKRQVAWSNMHSHCLNTKLTDATITAADVVSFRYIVRVNAVQSMTADVGAEEQSFDVSRDVSNMLPVILNFPKHISIETSTSVVNTKADGSIPGQAALYSVSVLTSATASTAQLSMVLVSTFTYPDYASAATVTSTPTDISASVFENTAAASCADTAGSVCKQFWKVNATVASTSNRCDFSGSYTFRFTLACKASYTSSTCPSNTMTVTAQIKTLSHCPQITTATLSASMTTYKDNQFATESTSYRLRDVVYGHFVTTSDTSTISSTRIKQLVLRQTGFSDITMIDNFALTTPGNTALCAFWNSGSTTTYTLNARQARFSCKLVPSQVVLPSGAQRTVTWYVLAEVEYENTASDGTIQIQRRLMATEINHDNHQSHQRSSLSNNNNAQASVNTMVMDHEAAELMSTNAMTASSAVSTTAYSSWMLLMSIMFGVLIAIIM